MADQPAPTEPEAEANAAKVVLPGRPSEVFADAPAEPVPEQDTQRWTIYVCPNDPKHIDTYAMTCRRGNMPRRMEPVEVEPTSVAADLAERTLRALDGWSEGVVGEARSILRDHLAQLAQREKHG